MQVRRVLPVGARTEIVALEIKEGGTAVRDGQRHIGRERVSGIEMKIELLSIPADGQVELVSQLPVAKSESLVPRGDDQTDSRSGPQKVVVRQQLVAVV